MKVNFTDKKSFTGNELEEIKGIQSDKEFFNATLESITDVIRNYGRILNISYTWSYNRWTPYETFWGNGIDIMVEAYIEYDNEIRYISTTMYLLNMVGSREDLETCGYQQVFKRV